LTKAKISTTNALRRDHVGKKGGRRKWRGDLGKFAGVPTAKREAMCSAGKSKQRAPRTKGGGWDVWTGKEFENCVPNSSEEQSPGKKRLQILVEKGLPTSQLLQGAWGHPRGPFSLLPQKSLAEGRKKFIPTA